MVEYTVGGAGAPGASFRAVLQAHKYNFIFFIIGLVIAVIVAGAIALIWSLLTLLGTILLLTAAIMILLGRGQNIDLIFIVCLITGVVFILLSLAGVELGIVNLGDFEPLKFVNQFFGH